MMDASSLGFIADESVTADEVGTLVTGSEILAHTTDAIAISRAAPVYLLDGEGFVDVSKERPLTIRGSAVSHQADVAV